MLLKGIKTNRTFKMSIIAHMEIKELYTLIGQITYSYSRIDFWLSHIAVDFKIVTKYPDFFIKKSYSKIKELKQAAESNISDSSVLEEFKKCLDKLDFLREERNRLVHSIVLQSENELLFYNFKNLKNSPVDYPKEYTIEELSSLNDNFIALHNDIYTLWMKFKD